jgi:isochorismate synthase
VSGRLVARTEPVGSAYDLIADYRRLPTPAPSFFFERRGIGVAGIAGHPLEVPGGPDRFARASDAALGLLHAIEVETRGVGPVIVGAFPFGGTEAPRLHLLTYGVRRLEPATALRVEVRGAGGAPWVPFEEEGSAGAPDAGAPSAAFEEDRLRPVPSSDGYATAVATAVERIRAGDLSKVVLARTVELDAGRALEPTTLLRHLRAVDPECFTFATPTGGGGSTFLIGATPELLVSRRGREVASTPLAGSAPRYGDPAEDRAAAEGLLASEKDRQEHAFVVDAIAETLGPRCEDLTYPAEPELIGTANVWHLGTPFRGRLRDPAPTAIELAGALHPTPAVGGSPREPALALIDGLEPFDRACYAGPVGWMDADGDGEWAIALRCAEVTLRRARLFAGAGIVAGSDPAAELDETERKFRAFLDSLRWG